MFWKMLARITYPAISKWWKSTLYKKTMMLFESELFTIWSESLLDE